jgi:hypothetical protein
VLRGSSVTTEKEDQSLNSSSLMVAEYVKEGIKK